ncbi:2-amino-4-hydroxy-6-hydroxymethyldihydropteridine diphosphokinase [Luteimonas sp. BDR2-5]|uniref:2-amino-4-hydroxy-6- hydroxymethyldihydropteridine diphosphokinase n=1 Tax=Proluteimonas luteida TaxID=2878685 RepID=UPI001E329FC6|nr:2-amino-4-hydroxy-6-hydroxymethyldihydropteridine diphosphokinase [Luteimonas sp. BDR2-5]MCD9029974.1 2-amino-4-hydroxy-6-hydroxymethyldihydropteridine diphosphokinase [Luteimonas sp. BDR2-5]
MARAFVGLGGNLGDAAATLPAAAQVLAGLPGTQGFVLSSLYRTPAWGRRDQPDFINAVAGFDTPLAPRALLDALLAIEQRFGRTRAVDAGDRWGPRTLDLDLLLHGDLRVAQAGLCVPHPHLHQRAFALVPLLEIAPDAVIPGIGPAADALAGVDRGGIEAVR